VAKRFFAKKTVCAHGHKHDSAAEAKRCLTLHLMFSAREISDLEVHPRFDFIINGEPVKMGNGHKAGWVLDFSYRDGAHWVAEDVKSRAKWMDNRELALKRALFRHLYPGWKLKEVRP